MVQLSDQWGRLSRSIRQDQTDDTAAPTAFPVALALPAALARLSAEQGLATAGHEHRAAEQYGQRPGREALTLLADKLGVAVQFDSGSPSSLPDSELPLIALTKEGGAVIVKKGDKGRVIIEGATEAVYAHPATLDRYLGEQRITLALGDTTRRSLVQTSSADQDNDTGLGDTKTLLRWMMTTLWQVRRQQVIHLVAASLLSNLFLIALPIFIMSVYDRVIPHTAYESLQTLTIGIGIILLADVGLRHARLQFIDALGLSLATTLQRHFYRHLLQAPLAKRPSSPAGVNVVQTEAESLSLLVPEVIAGIVADVTFALMVMGLIVYIAGPVVLAPMVGTVLVILLVASAARSTREGARRSAQLRGSAANQVRETWEGLDAVKATGSEHHLLSRYEKISHLGARETHKTRHRLRFSNNIAGVLVQATVVATIFLGVMRIDAGAMTIGSLAAITILVGRAVMPIGQLTDNICRLRSLSGVVTDALRDAEVGTESGGDVSRGTQRQIRGSFTFDRVSVHHDGAAGPALQDISLAIKAGERIGVIGKNGSGKTTFLKLFPALLEPNTGALSLDAHDIRQYAPADIRRQIGYMPQETTLFDADVRENILMGADDISDDAFLRATQLSGVARFAARHPKGYSLAVGPRGCHLSAGERQAIGLARLLLRGRAWLILDEPTSMMDQASEDHVIQTLRSLPETCGFLVSTHRIRLLEVVDRVITLNDGQVVRDEPSSAMLSRLRGAA